MLFEYVVKEKDEKTDQDLVIYGKILVTQTLINCESIESAKLLILTKLCRDNELLDPLSVEILVKPFI